MTLEFSLEALLAPIKNWLFGLEFFLRTGCTQRWLGRVWRELIEKDVHPADTFRLSGSIPGDAIEISAFGSQVHVAVYGAIEDPADPELSRRLYEFTVNWLEESGFYVHEKRAKDNAPWEMDDWKEVFRQKTRARVFSSHHWIKTMLVLEKHMHLIDDRSHENMVGTEIHEGK